MHTLSTIDRPSESCSYLKDRIGHRKGLPVVLRSRSYRTAVTLTVHRDQQKICKEHKIQRLSTKTYIGLCSRGIEVQGPCLIETMLSLLGQPDLKPRFIKRNMGEIQGGESKNLGWGGG